MKLSVLPVPQIPIQHYKLGIYSDKDISWFRRDMEVIFNENEKYIRILCNRVIFCLFYKYYYKQDNF